MKKLLLSSSFLLLVAVGLMFLNSCEKQDKVSTPENDQEINMNFGFIPLPIEEYNLISQAKVDVSLKDYPISLVLDCPPVGNQGGEGSCVAWGTTYAGRSISYQDLTGGTYSFSTNIFSPEYVYNQIKVSDCGSGSYVTTGLNLLVNQGACTWNAMPYTDEECSTMPDANQIAEAANYKIASYQTVARTIDGFKQQLTAGKPIIVAGPVYKQFMYLGDGDVMTSTKGRNYGGHCYACVGYDDNLGAFKIQNSWGTNWGSSGFGWISYSLMTSVWSEAYVVNE